MDQRDTKPAFDQPVNVSGFDFTVGNLVLSRD